MADLNLPVESLKVTGLDATYHDDSSTDPVPLSTSDRFLIANDGRTFAHVKNGNSSTDLTVTIVTPLTVDGLAVADREVTVPRSEERFIGPFAPDAYNDRNHKTALSFSAVADVSIAFLRLP